jgi:uncharacterized protein
VSSTKPRYLLDLNALISLADADSIHYKAIHRWFDAGGGQNWGVCPLTESGFVRVTTNPVYRGPTRTVEQATGILAGFALHAGYRYWPITEKWAVLTSPFSARLMGHQQVTDAYLLGLAIRENGILVTFDKAIRYLAGAAYSGNLLVLESE